MRAARRDQRGGFKYSDQQIAARARWYASRPEKAKTRAERKLKIVDAWHAAVNGGASRGVTSGAICKRFNIDDSTLWRWLKAVDGVQPHAWLYFLADDYGGRTTRKEIDAESLECLKADYLRPERPSKTACITRLLENAGPDAKLPSPRTLLRYLRKIPRVVEVMKREGRAAAEHLYPAQQRLKSGLAALESINGDGYKHNLWVRFPDGEVIRAKTWFWQDVYSSKILAWRTDKTEHTEVIRLSFGDLIERYGIPGRVTLDNTMAAANKTMSGGVKHRFRFKATEEEALGVFCLVNTEARFTKVRWGQSKPIERTFGIGGIGEYVDKSPEFAGAWTGGSVTDKPDYDGKGKVVELADLARVMEREIAAFNAREGRRGAMQQGRSFDQVFEQSYASIIPRRATEEQRRLWLLANETVRGSMKSGEITLGAGRITGERIANRYWSSDMVQYAGRQVVARFDPARLYEGVHVYTLDGRYICFADCVQAAGFNDANAGREHGRARQTFLRAAKAQADAETRMSTLEMAKAYAGTEPPVIPAPAIERGKVVRGDFRDPLERPAPQAAALDPEQQAAMAALDREIAEAPEQRVVAIDDPESNYKRWLALQARAESGEQLQGDEANWHRAYQASAEWRAMEAMAEDFPELKQA